MSWWFPIPLIRIDYVWSAGGVVPAAARVACASRSDHCMVIADLQVGDSAVQGPNYAVSR
jgi:endonuclease/exonuclease/phosphatase (EEP) superfamily protein YafD